MRARNDMPLVAQTLQALARQTVPFDLVAYDNASGDGTREELARVASRVIDVPAGAYVPGRVLNDGMRATSGDWVVFLNSDCTPVDDRWLERLLAAADGPGIAAVFGRQVPRPGCHPIHALDTERAYGDGSLHRTWRHFFSMASSAIRRSVWEAMPFSETLQYSEDIDWTWRARQAGHEIRYVPDAVVTHSHDYTLRQLYRRHLGEGRADARIYDFTAWERSLVRSTLLPYGRQVARDVRDLVRLGQWQAAFQAPVVRAAQFAGHRAGFVRGLQERRG